MPNSLAYHVLQACRELGLNQKGLAELVGCSARTLQRNGRTGGLVHLQHFQTLIRALHARNPASAEQLAIAVGTNLAALGLLPPRSATVSREHLDAVIFAAADAAGVPPREARPMVAAIFARIAELDVDVGALAQALATPAAKPET